jgi:hypothetical protein
LEVLLVELELYQDISGEHREFTGAWGSTPKSKIVSTFQ